MMGIFLYYLQYVIAAILFYHIARCLYVKQGVEIKSYITKRYFKTGKDVRLKYPLWVWILFIVVFFVPVINLASYAGYLCYMLWEDDESNPYYCKSIFNNKY